MKEIYFLSEEGEVNEEGGWIYRKEGIIMSNMNRKVFHQDDGRQVIHPGGRDILSGDFKEVSRNG